ncbi:MAG: DUF3833 domain-containing protein [Pontibacterium sp.]
MSKRFGIWLGDCSRKLLQRLVLMLTIGGFLVLGSGCGVSVEDYQGKAPSLQLDQYFNGQLKAYGMVEDYSGKVTRRFKAQIVGTWKGDQGVLDERFEFDDGEIQYRCWRLEKSGDTYIGVAGDVVGQAKGKVSGNVLNWQYVLQVPVGERKFDIHLNDWLYLLDDKRLMNKADMTKWGVKVGEITLFIEKISHIQPKRPLVENCQL